MYPTPAEPTPASTGKLFCFYTMGPTPLFPVEKVWVWKWNKPPEREGFGSL